MTINKQVHQYIHDYIHVFLDALREHSIILSIASTKELDEFYENVKPLENKNDYSVEELRSILPLSEYFSSVSTEFVVDLLENNGSTIPSAILRFMHQSVEISRILRELK